MFLEHLGGWGGRWTAQDFEHISITVLFIGGGLVGDEHTILSLFLIMLDLTP